MRIAGEHGASAVYCRATSRPMVDDAKSSSTRRATHSGSPCIAARGSRRSRPTCCIPRAATTTACSRRTGGHGSVRRARAVHSAPRRIRVPKGLARAHLPELRELTDQRPSPDRASGGESAGTRALAHLDGVAAAPLRRAARRSRRRWHIAHQRRPALRLHLRTRARGAARRPRGRGCVPPPGLLARLLPPGACRLPTIGIGRLPAERPALAASEADLAAWQAGCTGYPIVDAGMRQLQQEGWMHNRRG